MCLEQKLISIIIPCYNGGLFIEQAILSVINQPLSSIEVIIVDDGSQDNTGQVCEKFLQDDRIKYFRTNNLGAGHARNYGIKHSNAKWIMFLDADDLYIDNCLNFELEQSLYHYEENSIDIILTSCCLSNLELSKAVEFFKASDNFEIIPAKEFWHCIYCREYLITNSIYFFEYKEQDVETAFKFMAFSNTRNYIVDNTICYYLQRNNPFSNTHTWQPTTVHYVKSCVFFDLLLLEKYDSEKQWLLMIVLNEMKSYYASVIHNGYYCKEERKKMNSIFRKCKTIKEHSLSPNIHILKIYILRLISIFTHKKNKNDKDFYESNAVSIISNQIIIYRKKYISLYIKKCLLESIISTEAK